MRSFLPAVALAALVGACSPSAHDTIEMTQREFVPATAMVATGETVTFVNESSEAHTVTAYEDELPGGVPYFASGGFTSEAEARAELARGLLRPGEAFAVTFEAPGTVVYFCLPHEQQGMTGTVLVRARED